MCERETERGREEKEGKKQHKWKELSNLERDCGYAMFEEKK